MSKKHADAEQRFSCYHPDRYSGSNRSHRWRPAMWTGVVRVVRNLETNETIAEEDFEDWR